jgi:hypothetical protein
MNKKIIFRYHAILRMFERQISEADVSEVIVTGKVIENYPTDQPYPSCLKFAYSAGRPIHIVVADNSAEQSFIIITVYEPDLDTWEPGFERRR